MTRLSADDFENGIISSGNPDFHYEVHYTNGDLPEIRVSKGFAFDTKATQKANELVNMLKFRQSSILMQGCAIVKAQKAFFEKGPGNLAPLTRRKIAQELGINESTVSRLTGRNSSRAIQTEFGTFKADYFFPSALPSGNSSEAVKNRLVEIIQEHREQNQPLSDEKLTQILNNQGIKISRRTVTKYRNQLGLENSYSIHS